MFLLDLLGRVKGASLILDLLTLVKARAIWPRRTQSVLLKSSIGCEKGAENGSFNFQFLLSLRFFKISNYPYYIYL